MVSKGNRRSGHPLLIKDGMNTTLQRVSLDTGTLNENWIQKLIHDNPELLPVAEIDTAFKPLIAIGREVYTPAGYLDNLFISPDGYLTLVETKLWRNPEARREVVGQIIDYAKEFAKWSYTDLDKSVKAFNALYNNNSEGLLATVRKNFEMDESDEQVFIDNISKNLKRGRFLLLIVGDGIRESVEDMVDYLSQYPQLYFTLALIELQVYKLSAENNSIFIIPQLVTRTKEITRAIVRVEGASAPDLKISIETDLGLETNKPIEAGNFKRLTITAQDFYEQLAKNTNKLTVDFAQQISKDVEAIGLFIEWNSSSYSAKLPDPSGSGSKISIFTVDRAGFVYLGYSGKIFQKLNIDLSISHRFSFDTAGMLPGIEQHHELKHVWNKYSTLSDLQKVYPSFLERVKIYVEEITNAVANGVE